MDVQVVSSQGQSSGIKTDGAFLPRILLSGFLLVSIVGDSAFPGLQTSVRKGTGPVYSAPSAAVTTTARGSGVVLGARAGSPNLFAPRAATQRCRQNRCASHESCTGDPCVSSTGDLLLHERPEFESVASSSSPHLH